jgi:rRNA maturation endonuclease Nob1
VKPSVFDDSFIITFKKEKCIMNTESNMTPRDKEDLFMYKVHCPACNFLTVVPEELGERPDGVCQFCGERVDVIVIIPHKRR